MTRTSARQPAQPAAPRRRGRKPDPHELAVRVCLAARDLEEELDALFALNPSGPLWEGAPDTWEHPLEDMHALAYHVRLFRDMVTQMYWSIEVLEARVNAFKASKAEARFLNMHLKLAQEGA